MLRLPASKCEWQCLKLQGSYIVAKCTASSACGTQEGQNFVMLPCSASLAQSLRGPSRKRGGDDEKIRIKTQLLRITKTSEMRKHAMPSNTIPGIPNGNCRLKNQQLSLLIQTYHNLLTTLIHKPTPNTTKQALNPKP